MPTILANTFSASLARLTNDEQKQAKLTAFDLQNDPSNPGLKFHRIDKSKDRNFWSVRVNRDLRIIVHKTGDSVLLAYVDHHDDAYAWAERRRIEAHPRTGALQIVEVRELVEEMAPAYMAAPQPAQLDLELPSPAPVRDSMPASRRLFYALSDDDLLSLGVPTDWTSDVREADEDGYLGLASHLPQEAAEALLEYAATGKLPELAAPAIEDALQHPDARRRFRIIEGADELQAALDAPFEQWTVFLHPSQREAVTRINGGPARVAGSAGTGKTVVALHRVRRHLLEERDTRILLTTFSEPLAAALRQKLAILCADHIEALDRVTIGSFQGIAEQLYSLKTGQKAHLADDELIASMISRAVTEVGATSFSSQFLNSEWKHVADAWQLESEEDYANVPRMGRKNRLGKVQRTGLWQVFALVKAKLRHRRLMTRSGLFAAVTQFYAGDVNKPFDHIIVDEAQDLAVPELRFLSAIAPEGPDALFFAGDLGQRIFQQPFSWKGLGIDVRGRAQILKVNYRTSHQIRRMADRLMPGSVRDVDGAEDDRRATVSVFEGPEPEIRLFGKEQEEQDYAAASVTQLLKDGFAPEEIGVFVRSQDQLPRARGACEAAGLPMRSSASISGKEGTALAGIMHLAKGLEFRAVVLMACDEGVLPLESRVAEVADEFELDEVVSTERQLLYVAATRARDRLLITGLEPGSEFLDDLRTAT